MTHKEMAGLTGCLWVLPCYTAMLVAMFGLGTIGGNFFYWMYWIAAVGVVIQVCPVSTCEESEGKSKWNSFE